MIVYTKNVPTKKVSRKEIKTATKTISRILWENSRLQLRSLENITVTVQFSDLNTDYDALCEFSGETNIRPSEFIISIDSKLSKRNILKSLIHEIVHMKQYRIGQLHQGIGENFRWLKKRINVDNVDYYFLPWEIEARGLEDVLYNLYKEEIKRACC